MCWKILISIDILIFGASWIYKAESFCYQGWIEDRGKCYRVFNTTVSWLQARRMCDVMNSALVTLDDITEQTFILQLRSTSPESNHWIGYFRNGTNWRWLHTMNTSIYNLNTTRITSGEDCAALTMMGMWNPTRCATPLPYICESEIKDCMISDGWFAYDKQCLYLTTGLFSWTDARVECNKLGADLAFVRKPYKDSALLMSNGVTSGAWIGLMYNTFHSQYQWLDGTSSNAVQIQRPTNFKCGAVSVNETTIEVFVKGYSCDAKMQGLCEKTTDQEQPVFTSTRSTTTTKTTTFLPTTKKIFTRPQSVTTTSFTALYERTSTVNQNAGLVEASDVHPNIVVLLAECLTGLDDEFIDDCIRDVFASYDSICYDNYQQESGEDDSKVVYTIEFYKRFVQHFEHFIERNMTFTLCREESVEAFLIVEMILDQTYPRTNFSVNDSMQITFEKLELGLWKSNRRDTIPFESHMTGCLVNEIDQTYARVVFAVINNDEILQVDTEESFSQSTVHYFLVSPVLIVSAYIGGRKTSVSLTFTLAYRTVSDIASDKHLNITQHDIVCAFYETRNKLWSTQGCQVINNDTYTVRCRCNHTTSFGIIMKVKVYEMYRKDEVALSVITYIGCSVSMVTMFIALTVFTCIRSLNSERVFVHRNLCVAILCAQILFLAAGKATRHKLVCRITAVVLHYCFLSIFSWMLVEGLHLYTKVVQVFGTDNSRNTYYLCFGWGLPLVLVLISSVADWEGYGTETSCWLSIDRKTIWAFIGPAIAVIVVNLVILIMVLRVVVSSSKNERTSKKDQIRAAIKAALFLLHLLGLTWIFGLLAVNRQLIVFEYIFSISNSLQGFFVFLFHCVLNTEVRQALRRVRERRAILNEDIHTVSMSSSGSETSSLAVEGTFRFRLSYNGGRRRCRQHCANEVNRSREGIKPPNIPAMGRTKELDVLSCRKSANNPILSGSDTENLPLVYI